MQYMIDQQQCIISSVPPCPCHRPSKITSEQLVIVKEFIRKHEEDDKDPPEPGEVCEFIETTFEITYGHAWVNTLVKKCPDIFIVDAYPLENERIDVCVNDLQTNHAELSQLLKTVDPHLVVNIDECGWGKRLSH